MQNPQSKNTIILWSLVSFFVTLVLGSSLLAVWEWNSPCPVKGEKRSWGRCYKNSQIKPLIIGTASSRPEEGYEALADYLQQKTGISVKLDEDTPFAEIASRIASKTWDIAFTRSPIFSMVAEDNGYIGVAVMFPDQPPYYRSALYVRSDSPIRSITDIKSTNTIALGSPDSAPTFHLPIYALYGKSLRVGTGYSPREAQEMVKAGEVNIGAGRYTTVKDDPSLRVIYVSRYIPGAGVYISPLLSATEREQVEEALLNAPPEIQAKANYGYGQIPNYSELKKIIKRTQQVLSCPSINIKSLNFKKPVKLFCQENQQKYQSIRGEIREYRLVNAGDVQLKLVTPSNRVYLVVVPKNILNQIPMSPMNALDKTVEIRNVKPVLLSEGVWEVKITRPEQILLTNSLS